MDNEKLMDIRNSLYRLPSLEERLKKLAVRLTEAQEDVNSLRMKYEAEAYDVERLEKESLSTTVLKLFGAYEGKLNKETEEMIAAKLAFDRATDHVKQLLAERDELSSRVSALRNDKLLYEAELGKRELEVSRSVTGEKSAKYRQLEDEKKELYKQLVETDEAIRAAERAKETAKRIIKHLDSADNWATYDVWFKGGIISHMAKYSHIDDAEADFNKLSSQMRELRRELKDVNMSSLPGFSGIDSTTRAVDFWFDNIFTDLNVRSRIRNDKDQAHNMVSMIQSIIAKLDNNKRTIKGQLSSIDQQKNDLLLG